MGWRWTSTDSGHVLDAVMKRWVFNWEKKGYRTKIPTCGSVSCGYTANTTSFHGSRANAGNPLNDVDAMVVAAYQTGNLLTDTWYEQNEAPSAEEVAGRLGAHQ